MPTFYTVGLCAEHLRISMSYLVEYKNVPWSKSSVFTSETLKVAENMNKSAVVIFYLRIHRGAPGVSSEWRAITPQSFKNNYDVLLKHGDAPAIRLSVNMCSHALKMHDLTGGASQLTLCAAAMFNSCPCVFDWFHSRWVCGNGRHYNGVGGGPVAIKMIIKWQTEATLSK